MENLRLSAFLQHVSAWPGSRFELEAAATAVSRLLNATFVAVHKVEDDGKTAWSLDGALEPPSPDAIEEYVGHKISGARDMFASFGGTNPLLKTWVASSDRQPWRVATSLNSLTLVSLAGEGRSQSPGARKSRVDYGWLLIATPRPLSAREEDLCLSAAMRLSSLASAAMLEADVKVRDQFLSIASHELKTPLTSIYGVLQLQERVLRLQKDEPARVLKERLESYLKMAIRQTQRLNELIDGLLDVSRIQNGRFFAEPASVDVAALLRETLSGRLAVIAQEAGVRLNLDAPDSLTAWVDPVRMEEVVTNLSMNAIRFSPEGGMVWVRLRDEGPMMRLYVRDQGPSLPPEDRERIFKPFERAQRTARFGGLGLGLFISRQIAQLHGGDVALVESVPGKGNLFEATFPTQPSNALNAAV